ncbi:hypothetical protein CASFOL_013399 [Castilleja foliolosa]|uniref:Uncharacterized protein n=1 Tax=Castilleja foliolosa TaxID=1961234 RepID=A0ABD3CII5_9LAMI
MRKTMLAMKSMRKTMLAMKFSPYNDLKTMNLTSKEESCFKKCVTAAINYHIKQMEVEKATNNGHSRSENRPTNQIDNKSPIKQFTRIEKGASSEMELEDQESCVPPVSIAAQDSRDDLLPEKIVQTTRSHNKPPQDHIISLLKISFQLELRKMLV